MKSNFVLDKASLHKECLAYIQLGFLSIVISVGVMYIFMYEFIFQYTTPSDIPGFEVFKKQFYAEIFAYRVFARELLVFINDFFFEGVKIYNAGALLNLASLMGFIIVFLMWMWSFRINSQYLYLPLLFLILLIGFSTYIWTPYTVPALFLIFAGIQAAEREKNIAFILWVTIGAFTHEITVLMIIYTLSRALWRNSEINLRSVSYAVTASVIWLLIYMGLRVYISTEAPAGGFYGGLFAIHNFTDLASSVVFITTIAMIYGFLAHQSLIRVWGEGYRDLVITLAFIIPYAIYMILVGVLSEFRLFTPFFPTLDIDLFVISAALFAIQLR